MSAAGAGASGAADPGASGAADPGAATVAAEPCPLCGTPDPLGLGVCPACSAAGRTADTLLFVDGPSSIPARSALERQLAERLSGAAGHGEVRNLVDGLRPLVRLPGAAAGAAVAAAADGPVPVEAVPLARAWTRLPLGLGATLVAVLVAGLLAGLMAERVMLVVTPAFAALLALLGLRRVRTPVLTGKGRLGRGAGAGLVLPESAREAIRDALGRLAPDGAARGLLLDTARMGAGLWEREKAAGRDEAGERIGALLTLAAEAATDLEHLDESLAILADREEEGWGALRARAAEAREALRSRLQEALAALGRARVTDAGEGGVAARLGAFTEALEADLSEWAEARREVERLLEA